MFDNLYSDKAIVASLHRETFFLPFTDETYHATKNVGYVFLIITILSYLFLQIAKVYKDVLLLHSSKEVLKAAYQATNLVVNLVLGIIGLYTIYTGPSTLLNPTDESDYIQLYTGYTNYSFLPMIQMGYQIWSTLFGIIFIGESPIMLLHHVSVMMTSYMSLYTSVVKYNFAAPLCFGVMELSSVPLAIMNVLKDKGEWTKKHFAKGFAIVRVTFAISFLYTRIYLQHTIVQEVIRCSFLFHWTLWEVMLNSGAGDGEYDIGLAKFVMTGFDLVLKCVLILLQYYWGYLIVNGLIRMVVKKDKKKTQ